jgi:hypothetical protein
MMVRASREIVESIGSELTHDEIDALVTRAREVGANWEHELDPRCRFSRIAGKLYGFRVDPEADVVLVNRGPTDAKIREWLGGMRRNA